MDDDKITSHRILGLLKERHTGTDWAFFQNLRNSTGWPGQLRVMDAYAMHMWPSKKWRRLAYEIKVSRHDFLRELQDPAKRDFALEVANEFWFVAPKGAVLPQEIPQGTGLLEVTAGGLRTAVAAQWRDLSKKDVEEGLPIWFAASLLRKAGEAKPEALKLFKYAGRELTEADLLKLIDDTRDSSDRYEIEKAAKKHSEAMLGAESKPYRIATILLKAMGRSWQYEPDEEDVQKWVKDHEAAASLGEMRTAFDRFLSAGQYLCELIGKTDPDAVRPRPMAQFVKEALAIVDEDAAEEWIGAEARRISMRNVLPHQQAEDVVRQDLRFVASLQPKEVADRMVTLFSLEEAEKEA